MHPPWEEICPLGWGLEGLLGQSNSWMLKPDQLSTAQRTIHTFRWIQCSQDVQTHTLQHIFAPPIHPYTSPPTHPSPSLSPLGGDPPAPGEGGGTEIPPLAGPLYLTLIYWGRWCFWTHLVDSWRPRTRPWPALSAPLMCPTSARTDIHVDVVLDTQEHETIELSCESIPDIDCHGYLVRRPVSREEKPKCNSKHG